MSDQDIEQVTTEQPTPPTDPAPAVAPPVEPEQQAAEAPAYVPNYKFKAYDKEYDFPDWAKGLVKDKELEEKFRQEFAKSHALDEFKEKYTKVQPYREKYETIEQNIAKLEKHLNEGNLDSFFGGLGYKADQVEKMLSKYVLDKINYRELPEEQKRAIEQAKQEKMRAQEYEEKYSKVQSELEETKVRQLDTELRITLSDPAVADLARQWDERLGKPGSFREEVIMRADQISKQLGRIVTPQEAVNEFSAYASKMLGSAQPMQPQQPQVPGRPKPVLPNINNKSAGSPAKQKFKSLEDLEKYVGERFGG